MNEDSEVILILKYDEAVSLKILLAAVVALTSKIDKPLANKPYIESVLNKLKKIVSI